VRQRLEQPAIWAAIESFAAILCDRRRLEADEASAILAGLRPPSAGEPSTGELRRIPDLVLLAIASAAIVAIVRLLA
jgi:hypothetical protein